MPNDIVPYVDTYPMIAPDQSAVLAAAKANLDNETLNRRDLFFVVPNPSGGAECWTVETPMGKNDYEELTGIILHVGSERTMYEHAYGEGDESPPLCSSENGINAIGDPGGKCTTCQFSKFAVDGTPPLCGQKKPLYMLIPEINQVMPVVLNVSGPSFPALKAHLVQLMRFGMPFSDVEIKIKLRGGKSKNGKDVSVIQFKVLRNLKQENPEQHAVLASYQQSLLAMVDPAQAALNASLANAA